MHNNIAVGAGLISLDVLIWDGKLIPVGYYVGGTCGNVMMILAHMGWESYPIARLDETKDAPTAMEGSFGTQKEHYDLRRVKARTKLTEILYIFVGIHTANVVQLADRIEQIAQLTAS